MVVGADLGGTVEEKPGLWSVMGPTNHAGTKTGPAGGVTFDGEDGQSSQGLLTWVKGLCPRMGHIFYLLDQS